MFVGYKNFKRWKDFNHIKFLIKNPLSKLLIRTIQKFYNHRAISKIKDFQDIEGNGIESFYANSRSVFLKDEINKLFINKDY